MLLVESGGCAWSRTFLAEILREIIHRKIMQDMALSLKKRIQNGTQVVFTHDGFAQVDEAYEQTRGNWEYIGQPEVLPGDGQRHSRGHSLCLVRLLSVGMDWRTTFALSSSPF